MQSIERVYYQPIGVVRTQFVSHGYTPPAYIESRGSTGCVEVYSQYVEGLKDLEGFSHVVLLCHLHLSRGYELKVVPRRDTVIRGVFATRSPRRPNPISLTVVRLLHINQDTLHVMDIDLVDGTPVLDIKPYIPLPREAGQVRTGWLETLPDG